MHVCVCVRVLTLSTGPNKLSVFLSFFLCFIPIYILTDKIESKKVSLILLVCVCCEGGGGRQGGCMHTKESLCVSVYHCMKTKFRSGFAVRLNMAYQRGKMSDIIYTALPKDLNTYMLLPS